MLQSMGSQRVGHNLATEQQSFDVPTTWSLWPKLLNSPAPSLPVQSSPPEPSEALHPGLESSVSFTKTKHDS